MTRVLVLVVLACVAAFAGGCGSSIRTAGAPNVEVPANSDEYSTDARSGGVRGGGAASDAEALLEKALEARGDDADSDGVLADTAAWLLRRAYGQEDMTAPTLGQDAAIRFGFAGEFHGWAAMSLDTDAQQIEVLVSQVPKNSVINRYGIVAGQGRDVAIVLGGVQVTLDDFPRAVAPGATLRLKGEVSDLYERTSVHSTNPNGKVREIPMKNRDIDASVAFAETGIHKLEIMGYGKTGPVVLLNVPIHVGVSVVENDSVSTEADPNLTAEDAEAMMLSFLNEERAKHGAPKVEPDAELRAVALGHSVDMATNHFAGHVSPTTGTPDQRLARAKVRVSKGGECVALEMTPAGAHRGLLDSPAHRAAMLDPAFTHVGVGVAFEPIADGRRRLAATLFFGRRPPTDDTVLAPAEILDILNGIRRARKLPELRADPVLMTAAGAAASALKSGAAKTPQQALAVSDREIRAAVQRTRVSRTSCQFYAEIIDRYQFTEAKILKYADVRGVGIGTAPVQSDVGTKLAVIVAVDAGGGKAVKVCE